MIHEWWDELKSNFWYDLNDLLWSLVYGIGGLMLMFELLNRYR